MKIIVFILSLFFPLSTLFADRVPLPDYQLDLPEEIRNPFEVLDLRPEPENNRKERAREAFNRIESWLKKGIDQGFEFKVDGIIARKSYQSLVSAYRRIITDNYNPDLSTYQVAAESFGRSRIHPVYKQFIISRLRQINRKYRQSKELYDLSVSQLRQLLMQESVLGPNNRQNQQGITQAIDFEAKEFVEKIVLKLNETFERKLRANKYYERGLLESLTKFEKRQNNLEGRLVAETISEIWEDLQGPNRAQNPSRSDANGLPTKKYFDAIDIAFGQFIRQGTASANIALYDRVGSFASRAQIARLGSIGYEIAKRASRYTSMIGARFAHSALTITNMQLRATLSPRWYGIHLANRVRILSTVGSLSRGEIEMRTQLEYFSELGGGEKAYALLLHPLSSLEVVTSFCQTLLFEFEEGKISAEEVRKYLKMARTVAADEKSKMLNVERVTFFKRLVDLIERTSKKNELAKELEKAKSSLVYAQEKYGKGLTKECLSSSLNLLYAIKGY